MLSENLEGMKGIAGFQALAETFALQGPTVVFSCRIVSWAQHCLSVASNHLWRGFWVCLLPTSIRGFYILHIT